MKKKPIVKKNKPKTIKPKFKAGDRVAVCENLDGKFVNKICYYGKYETTLWFGKVVEILTSSKVLVLWDDEWMNDQKYEKDNHRMYTVPIEANVNKLFLAKDAKAQLFLLEKEFKKAELKVKFKIKEAAQIIKEANEMAKVAGVSSIDDMDEEVLFPLLDVISKIDGLNNMDLGWQSSSYSC